jgi:methyl-accepting chemotaxis protein
MNLRTLFAIPIITILVVTLSLAGMLAGQGWSGQAQGQTASLAVERMRLLLELQTSLRAERVATNLALGKPYPLPDAVRRQLDDARRETDLGIGAVAADFTARNAGEVDAAISEAYLTTVLVRLGAARAMVDALIARGQNGRTFAALDTVMPRLLVAAQPLDEPLEQASLTVTRVDASLSGLVILNRLAASLRDELGVIAAVLLPRFDNAEQPTGADLETVRISLARTSFLTRVLGDTIEIAGATEPIRLAFRDLRAVDTNGIMSRLKELANPATPNAYAEAGPLPVQLLLVPWGERINALRGAIVNTVVQRVTTQRAQRERRFDLGMAAIGFILVAVLESVILLGQRVVRPLAELGLAITRIAAGDRSVALSPGSDAREITEMVTAVETLRQAALVADATVRRHRMAARQRMLALREALGIVQSVREPAHVLERGVARLSEGIAATIALVTTPTTSPPPTLGAAAAAVRVGLAEMRESAADLDAMFAAAGSAQTEDRPEAEFVAHILAVQAQVDRRSEAVRGFVQPSLVALRDTASATGGVSGPVLRDLVSDQFARIEETVAVIAAMAAAVSRAAAIVRDLPLDDTPMAA